MKRIITATTLLIASTPALMACSACFGKSDSAMARSLNASIFTLMGVAGTVLAGAASFFVILAKRAAAFERSQQSTPPPSEPQA